MFLEYLYAIPTNASGIDKVVTDTIVQVPAIASLILFFVFMTVFIGGITRQSMKALSPDYPAWAMVSSIATLLVALLFSVQAGFIRLDWLVIVVAINIMSAIWFFLDKRINEV